jgi:hypothetical protein
MNHEVKSVVIVDRDNLTKKPAATTSIAVAMRRQQSLYPSLEEVTRPNLKTEEAAHYLNRRPQTLRAWACLERWYRGTAPEAVSVACWLGTTNRS